MSSTQSFLCPFKSVADVMNYLQEATDPPVTSWVPASPVASNQGRKTNSNRKIPKCPANQIVNTKENVKVLPSGRVKYGPITINPRKQPSKTLFTGRRSKYEVLQGDDEVKRQQRRERNRLAATKCREKRECVLIELENIFERETKQYSQLINLIENLKKRKELVEKLLDNHQPFCVGSINAATLNGNVGLVFGDTSFLSSISETPAPPLPPSRLPTEAIFSEPDEINSSNYQLINSIYSNEKITDFEQAPFTMSSSSVERLFNNLHTPTISMESNCQGGSSQPTDLYNSAYGTCAQQHSSSGEDESLPSVQKQHFVF